MTHRFLLCPPTHYNVRYVINPWMEGNVDRIRPEVAMRQWEALRDIIAARASVELIEPVEGLADMTFVGSAALVCGKRAVLSRFRYPQRQAEEPHILRWLESAGCETLTPPLSLFFEGAGDAVFDRDGGSLWVGYGFRTVLEACQHIADALHLDVIPLHLVDKRFYNLSSCLRPLTGGHLLYYPSAFNERSRAEIERRVPAAKRHALDAAEAGNFVCSLVDLGDTVVMHRASDALKGILRGWGFKVIETELSEFLLSGGSADDLVLRLSESAARVVPPDQRLRLAWSEVLFRGHIIDSGVMDTALDIVMKAGGAFDILRLEVGKSRGDESRMALRVTAPDRGILDALAQQLNGLGGVVGAPGEESVYLETVGRDGVAPDDFYSTTIFPTEVRLGGEWVRVLRQRMDAVVVVDETASLAASRLIRDLRAGDRIVVGSHGIRVLAARESDRHGEPFRFMSATASSERRAEGQITRVADEMLRIKRHGGRIVVVAGPVVVHTGGGPYLGKMIHAGYVSALLGGNAIGVHDIEQALFGTSLGVSLQQGAGVPGGHMHHLRAINAIRRCGSIRAAVEQGILAGGIMYELIREDVPFCLAGSIRDDGPLPDTEMDMITAQAEYTRLLEGAEMILLFSTMLHAIGVGNMTPAGVRLVCVDINPAVATKLMDRGSMDSTAIVTDVGLFLSLLWQQLEAAGSRPRDEK